jgi:orotate phosphoribosyltransferase
MMLSREQIARKLLEINAVMIVGESNLFTWASGIRAPIYCDNRLIMGYPEFRKEVAEVFAEKIKLIECDVIVGTATAGIPHAAWVSDLLNMPMAYVRSSSKGHGKQNQIEGIVKPGQKVVVIEDLFSTGGSALTAVEALREVGASVQKVISIFSYNFSSLNERFESAQVSFESLTDYKTLLPIAKEIGYIDEKDFEVLSQWSQNPRMFTK